MRSPGRRTSWILPTSFSLSGSVNDSHANVADIDVAAAGDLFARTDVQALRGRRSGGGSNGLGLGFYIASKSRGPTVAI